MTILHPILKSDILSAGLAPQEWIVTIRDLDISCLMGIYPHEQTTPCTIRLNIRCAASFPCPTDTPTIQDVVCYERIITDIRQRFTEPFYLVETACEEVSRICLEDSRVDQVWVRLEKLNTLGAAVGVEIHRERRPSRGDAPLEMSR